MSPRALALLVVLALLAADAWIVMKRRRYEREIIRLRASACQGRRLRAHDPDARFGVPRPRSRPMA